MSRYFPEPGDVQIVISTHRGKGLSIEEISALFAAVNPILGPAVTVHHVKFEERPRLASLKEVFEVASVQAADRIQRDPAKHKHVWVRHLLYRECTECNTTEALSTEDQAF